MKFSDQFVQRFIWAWEKEHNEKLTREGAKKKLQAILLLDQKSNILDES